MNNGFTYQINVQVLGNSGIGQLGNSLAGVEGLIRETNGLLGTMNNQIRGIGTTAHSSFSFANMGLTSFIGGLGLAATTMSSLNKTADIEGLNKAITFSGKAGRSSAPAGAVCGHLHACE